MSRMHVGERQVLEEKKMENWAAVYVIFIIYLAVNIMFLILDPTRVFFGLILSSTLTIGLGGTIGLSKCGASKIFFGSSLFIILSAEVPNLITEISKTIM